MFLNGIEERDITDCKNKKSTGNDNIDMSIIKLFIIIVKQLTHICNISFRNCTFPDQMKVAKVIPVFKGNGKQVFTNYIRISLLPQFSKISGKKLFNVRLDNFIERHSILSNSQYGFRPNMSKSLALLELTVDITSALDNKKKYYWCFYRLKKGI